MSKNHSPYTDSELRKIAAKYSTRGEFNRKANGACQTARKRGKLFYNSICAHMIPQKRRWTDYDLRAVAAKYSTRYKFSRGDANAYAVARRRGLLDSICAHMKPVQIKWTPETIKAEALKYSTRSEFTRAASGAVFAAQRLKIMDDVCAHMHYPRIKWTVEKIEEAAAVYSTRSEFVKGNYPAYKAARRYKILDLVCAHMTPLIKLGAWTYDELLCEAFKYRTRSDFERECSGAASAARRLGVWDDICWCMVPEHGGFSPFKPAVLYFLEVLCRSRGALYKIGVTNRTVEQRFRTEDLDRITVLHTRHYENGADAYAEEQRILKEFAAYRYDGEPVLISDGNTELFTIDVYKLWRRQHLRLVS